MRICRQGKGRRSDMWVIRDGISFVYGFDRRYAALIMTLIPQKAKRFGSPSEAEVWIHENGLDLGSYRITDERELTGRRPWSWRNSS
jgi:hypothetical protein